MGMHRPALTLLTTLCLAQAALAADPVKKRPSDEERGQELYTRHCEACHGTWAQGDGPATQALVAPVPDLQGKVEVDNDLIQVVLLGKGPMPGYEQTIDRFDAKRVLDFMAALRTPEPGSEPAPAPDAEPEPEDNGAELPVPE